MDRICIITTAHSTFDTRIFEKQAKSLVEAGYDVDLYTPHEKKELVEGVQIVPMTEPRNRIHRFLLPFYVLFMMFDKEYDAYHIHDPELLFTGIILEYYSDTPVIFDVHEDYRLTLQNRPWIWAPLRLPAAKLYDVIEPVFVKRLSGVILAADDLQSNYEYHPLVETVGNYPQLKWTRKPTTLPNCDLKLVFVGGMSRQKPVIPFIQAVESTPDEYDIKLEICGSASDPHVENLVRAYAVGNPDVTFHGWISHEKVMDICAESDIGLISLTNDFLNGINAAYRSRKLFEYLATENAILAPDFGNWSDIVEKHGTGLTLDVNNPQEICDVITELADDRPKVNQYKRNAREAVVNKFNWETQNEKMLDFYETVTR